MKRSDVLTDPKKLVRAELANSGFDLDKINVPKRVYILADSLYDEMIAADCGEYKYPLGGKLYVFKNNEDIGFVKGMMCSPAIATQAEDLIAGGVKELVHIGFAGGLQPDMKPGDIVLTDGAYNDTAVAGLYGFDCEIIKATCSLTDEMSELLGENKISFCRGLHWTTDAGYMETWGQVFDHRNLGALCVEMEGVGLFTAANYRGCSAAGIYVVSDVYTDDDWKLGWSEKDIDKSVKKIINAIIPE